MVREHFTDRNLGTLLGKATYGNEAGLNYVEFEYLQTSILEDRGVDWLDDENI